MIGFWESWELSDFLPTWVTQGCLLAWCVEEMDPSWHSGRHYIGQGANLDNLGFQLKIASLLYQLLGLSKTSFQAWLFVGDLMGHHPASWAITKRLTPLQMSILPCPD